MQHSGYVDSVPKYRELFDTKFEMAFNRFSSVNIKNLFQEGENYLLDYDCLVIGTNATSDGNVYKVLQAAKNKELLHSYIQAGKGLLICSQKKLIADCVVDDYNVRKTNFLPDDYEYNVISRPREESSSDGTVEKVKDEYNDTQSVILNIPYVITDEVVKNHCETNDFQKHYYRDFINPKNESSYFPLLVDANHGERNMLMVASPRNNEHIVISTMALDWAGHYELLENILRYLISGIPNLAFMSKKIEDDDIIKSLVAEAQYSKISYEIYNGISEVEESQTRQYHSIFVFSSMYTEDEVTCFWDTIKPAPEYGKVFHFRQIKGKYDDEIVVVCYSKSKQIDAQRREVLTWLASLYDNKLWDNSFWKTYDVILTFTMLNTSIAPYIKGVFDDIQSHYKDGSYDGVLAPTCGLLEILKIISSNEEYLCQAPASKTMLNYTVNWLTKKFEKTSNYNKKFILRAFYKSDLMCELKKFFANDDEAFKSELHRIVTEDTVSIQDKSEVDLILDIETSLIYQKYSSRDSQKIKKKIKDCVDVILSTQQQNGRWDNNLGKTSRILLFLLEFRSELSQITNISKSLDLGVKALRKSYLQNNWDENIVSTSVAIRVLSLCDKMYRYVPNVFLVKFCRIQDYPHHIIR